GDLAAEHVVVDGGAVVGVVDWSEARVADPADDLAWLLAATTPEAERAPRANYADAREGAADDAFDARATRAGELAVARWLMHGVRIRSDEVIEDAIDMLRDLDDAVADASPIGHVEPVVDPLPPRLEPERPPVVAPSGPRRDGEPREHHDGRDAPRAPRDGGPDESGATGLATGGCPGSPGRARPRAAGRTSSASSSSPCAGSTSSPSIVTSPATWWKEARTFSSGTPAYRAHASRYSTSCS